MMSQLLSPTKIGSLEVRNRFVRSATFECLAEENGQVSEGLLKIYRNLAKGGVGLIITSHLYVNQGGKAYFNQAGIDSDDKIPGLKRLVHEVHERGGRIVFQLSHAGRQTSRLITGQTPLGPSSRGRDPMFFVKPREMTDNDIQETIQSFAQAASRAVQAGADGLQLHGAHGYLINQFLSPFFNVRRDSWGGSEESRFCFLEQVLSEVRKRVGGETPILIKLNTHDHTPRQGITPDLATHYAERLANIGIDGVEVSSGSSIYSFMNMCRGEVPVQEVVDGLSFWKKPLAKIMLNKLVGKYDLEEGYHLEAAKLIKPVIGQVPLLLVGGMRRVSHMEELIEEGCADFISMSRPFIREPHLVQRIEQGKTDRASCVSCNKCLGAVASRMPLRCYGSPIQTAG